MEAVFALIAVAALAGVVALLVFERRKPGLPADASGPLGEVAAALRELSKQSAVLTERVDGVQRRVAGVEGVQGELRSSLAQTGTVATGLRDATESIRRDLAEARTGLAGLHERASARERLEQQTAESVRRLEQVLAGTSAKGAAGEHLVDAVFSRLPVEWQVRDFRVGNRTCEFGLRLPNGLVLPIDSKWPATQLIEQFIAAEEPAARQRLKSQIETAVLDKAGEVTKYIDPQLTPGFGVAVVPDAVYELSAAVQGRCVAQNVAVVGQSMFVPYLLLVFQVVLRSARDIDFAKLETALQAIEQSLAALQGEVEGRLSRSLAMLENSRDGLRLQTSRAAGQLEAVRVVGGMRNEE